MRSYMSVLLGDPLLLTGLWYGHQGSPRYWPITVCFCFLYNTWGKNQFLLLFLRQCIHRLGAHWFWFVCPSLSVCHRTLTLRLKWIPCEGSFSNFICMFLVMSSTSCTILRSLGRRSRSHISLMPLGVLWYIPTHLVIVILRKKVCDFICLKMF